MGNENIKNEVQNLQKLMANILEDNKKMNEKIEKMGQNILNLNEENKMQNEEIQLQKKEIQLHKENISKLEQELTDLKESFDYLKCECQDMKESLSNIQCRDLAKNFLRVFGTLLTDDDWSYIRKNKNEKGKIIAKRIKELYPKANKKKYKIIKNMVENSSDLIQQGNDLAYNVTLDKYNEEIQDYKEEKGIKTLESPLAFCFLISIGIADNLFDDAYSFLIQFFDKNLKAFDGIEFLDLYFK